MFSMETETAKVWKSHFRPAIVFISFAHVLLTKGQARTGRNGDNQVLSMRLKVSRNTSKENWL